MSDSYPNNPHKFVGRGEELTDEIIQRLYRQVSTYSQYPIRKILTNEEREQMDDTYSKHNFDFVFLITRNKEGFEKHEKLCVEVNYKHGDIPSRKWHNIFKPYLEAHGYKGVTIDHWDCRSLFELDSRKEHELCWDDFRDVIDALEKAGVKP